MSNRHERRANVAEFRRRVGNYLDTTLVPAGTRLDDHPVFASALVYWESQRQAHSRQCIACMEEFDPDGETVGAFLFATAPSMPGSASVSAICKKCVLPPLGSSNVASAC
jgi:hypothetical protein